MDDILEQRSAAYAKRRKVAFAELLGCGIHGMVRVAENNENLGPFAVKIHRYEEAYLRERTIYQRLGEREIVTLCGFNVPQLLGWDDEYLAVEMSIVARPFVLDFAGAWLDFPPEFSPEAWSDWEAEKQELFGERWGQVQQVLAVLKSHGIFMLDVSQANVAFRS